jgi:hypothetical protein
MTNIEVGIKKESSHKRPKEVAHDESPAVVSSHAFEPIAEWWSRCKHCSLYEAAHAETTLHHPVGYVSDDMQAEE